MNNKVIVEESRQEKVKKFQRKLMRMAKDFGLLDFQGVKEMIAESTEYNRGLANLLDIFDSKYLPIHTEHLPNTYNGNIYGTIKFTS